MTNQSSSPATSELLPCPLGCTSTSPQHMYREICRDMKSPAWNKPQSRIWCPCCGISMTKEGIEEVRIAWNTRTPAPSSADTEALERVTKAIRESEAYWWNRSDEPDDGLAETLARAAIDAVGVAQCDPNWVRLTKPKRTPRT